MAKRSPRRSGCPLNATLEALGDQWSLLVIRDLLFVGRRTFKEFLEAGEGVASNILADRLQSLETEGIISKRRDPQDARRFRYLLTAKGLDLAPVLVEMILWGARYHRTDAPAAAIREMTRNRDRFIAAARARAGEELR